MKLSKLFLVGVFTLFITAVNAADPTFIWTGDEDLSSINAQIVCTGTDCILSNIGPGEINAPISIDGVTGLNSFIFVAKNDNEFPTNMITSGGDAPLKFNDFHGGNIELNGNIRNLTNTYAFYFNNSYLSGNMITNGNLYTDGLPGFRIDNSTINGDMITNGNIYAHDAAILILDSNIGGDMITSGYISTELHEAIVITNSQINGNIITNGELSSQIDTFNLKGSDIGGDMITNGDVYAGDTQAFIIETSTINGDIITNGNVSAGVQAFSIVDSNINGDIITNGNVSAFSGSGALRIRDSMINGDIITNGDISAANSAWAFYIQSSTVNGNMITNGNISDKEELEFSIFDSIINGDMIIDGDVSGRIDSLRIHDLDISGDMITNGDVYTRDSGSVVIDNSTISGNMIINGDVSTGGSEAFRIQNLNINGNMIINGDVYAIDDNAVVMDSSTVNGNIINNGKIVAGTINPDGTVNATGDRALSYYTNTINKNFINTGTIASASYGIWMSQTRIFGDIINSGQILGGETDYSGEETVGLYIVDSALMGKIQNTHIGTISGGYGITLSQDYKDGTAGTYAAKDMIIHNNGTIFGYVYDAIAFDITSSDDVHSGTGLSYDNILSYSGAGVLNSAVYDIDMGAGTDVLNLTNVRGEWFTINGAETINVSNYIVQSKYTDDSTDMNTHTDSETTNFNVSSMGFLVNTTGTYTAGSDLYVMSGADAMTDEDLANMSIQLEGFAGTDGYFFMDGSDLRYHLNSIGIIGAHSDQAIATATAPSITAVNSSIVSAQNMNRSAMNLVSGRTMKTNNDFSSAGLWAQGFGEQSKYEGKNVNNSANSVGYDSDRYGMAIGYDKYLGDGLLLGVAVSYGLGDIQGEADQFETDIKQYQLNLYGSYNIENYFIDTQIGIGTTKYDQKRAYLLNDATAEYNSKSISAGFGMGYIWDATEKLSITPYTRFSYIQSNQDEYVESSNLKVDEVELISKQASLGTEVAYNLLSAGGMKFQPKVFMEYAQEMGDDEIAIESQYMDNMAIGTTGYSPDLGNSIIRTGVGIMMMGANNDYSIGIDYRYETRDRYTSNGLMLNGKLFF